MYLIRLSTLLALAALLVPAAIAQAAPAEDAYAAAAGLYSAQQWEQAAEALGQFLAQYPDHERATVARFYRGEALAQLGRHESAASLHGEFLTLAPQHALARVAAFRVGECLLLAGKGDEAKTRLEEFRRSHPQDELNAFALPYLGEIALAAGKTAEAEDLYVQALSDYPSGLMAAESRFGLASCRQKSGQAADAIALYQQVATDTNHALADDARLRIGLVHYDAQQFADAEESFSAFRTTFAESQLAPQARYWLGMSQQAQGRAAEAAATLAAAAAEFEQAEQAPALHAAAGDAFRHAGDTARADAHFQRLIADWPQSEWADDALLGRAELALAAGEADRAATLAAELAEKYPQSPHAGLAGIIRARSLLAEEQFAAAEELLQPLVVEAKPEAATDGPPAASAANHQLAYLLALAQIGQKKHEAALASLDKIGDLPEGDSLAAPVAEARCSALLGLERFDDAAALLQQRIESDSGGEAEAAELSVQLVVALARSGKLGQAVAQIQNLPQNAVQSQEVAAVVLLAAEEAYKSNNLPTAESLFTLAAGEGVPAAERSLALSGLAWTQYRRSGKQASAATFDRLLRDFPSSPLAAEAALVRAKSLEDVKQYDAAISTYRLIIDKYATSPWLTHALWGAARLHDQLNQDREAAELLTRLVNDYPDFTHRDAALYQLGWVHADLQGHASSEAAHAQLLKEYPESEFWADAAYHLAEQAARRQENSRAIELTDQLLAHKSGAGVRENALYLRGQLAAAEGKWDEVARYMGDHALQYPASAMNLSARYWHAEAAFRKGDYDGADKLYAELDNASKSRRDTWLGVVPLRRAQCQAQRKRWTETLELAQSVGERYPDFPQLYEADYLLGRALGSQARFTEARTAYGRVLQSSAAQRTETAAMAQWMIGETYFHQKRYIDAIAAYERCFDQHEIPRWQAAALLQAGKCRLLQGDSAAARRDLERVVTEFADQPVAAEARSRLEALAEPTTAVIDSAAQTR